MARAAAPMFSGLRVEMRTILRLSKSLSSDGILPRGPSGQAMPVTISFLGRLQPLRSKLFQYGSQILSLWIVEIYKLPVPVFER